MGTVASSLQCRPGLASARDSLQASRQALRSQLAAELDQTGPRLGLDADAPALFLIGFFNRVNAAVLYSPSPVAALPLIIGDVYTLPQPHSEVIRAIIVEGGALNTFYEVFTSRRIHPPSPR